MRRQTGKEVTTINEGSLFRGSERNRKSISQAGRFCTPTSRPCDRTREATARCELYTKKHSAIMGRALAQAPASQLKRFMIAARGRSPRQNNRGHAAQNSAIIAAGPTAGSRLASSDRPSASVNAGRRDSTQHYRSRTAALQLSWSTCQSSMRGCKSGSCSAKAALGRAGGQHRGSRGAEVKREGGSKQDRGGEGQERRERRGREGGRERTREGGGRGNHHQGNRIINGSRLN